MDLLKSLARGLLGLVFKFSLVLLAVSASLLAVFGTPDRLKQSVNDSGLYETGVESVVKSAAKDARGEGDTNYDHQVVQDAAKAALTPDFLKTSFESIINGFYGWLEGKTDQPQFSVDVKVAKDRFVTAASDAAVARAKGLPVCTLAQARELAGSEIDPFTVPCVPPGYDVESLRGLIAAQLDKPAADGQGNILQQDVLTPETLPKDDHGKTAVQNFTEDAEQLPQLYGFVKILPWILAVLAVVTGSLILLLHADKRRGLRSLAITLAWVGVVALIGILITNWLFGQLQNSGSFNPADANLKDPIISLVRSLVNAFNSRLLWFGVAYVALGAGTLAALHFTKPKTEVTKK